MTLTDARTTILTHLNDDWNAEYPTVPMVYDNQPFDWNSAPDNFVTLELQFYHSEQASCGGVPVTRWYGYAYFCSYTKEGMGVIPLLQQLDWLTTKFKYVNLGGIQFEAPMPDGTGAPKGFFGEHLKVPFFYNQFT